MRVSALLTVIARLLAMLTARLLAPPPTIRRLGLITTAAALIALAAASTALADISASWSDNGLTVSVSTPGPVLSGATNNYTITVTNTSAAPLPNVTSLIDLPDGLSLKTVSSNCVRNPLGGNSQLVAQCNFGTLAPGAGGSAVVGLAAPTPGTDTLDVTGLYQLPVPGGGFEVFSTPVTLNVPVSPGPTDIQVTGSSNNGSPPVGRSFQYTFQVKDNGPQGASGVSFNDTLPPALTFVSVQASIGTCSNTGNAIHCNVGTLATGQQSNIVITAIPTTTGALTDTASIAMTGPDTQPANNTTSITVQPK
jgi:uncharacterized repeat protein (TIGR01451 family)